MTIAVLQKSSLVALLALQTPNQQLVVESFSVPKIQRRSQHNYAAGIVKRTSSRMTKTELFDSSNNSGGGIPSSSSETKFSVADDAYLKELSAYVDDDNMSADEFMRSVDEFIQETLPSNVDANVNYNNAVGGAGVAYADGDGMPANEFMHSVDEFIQETLPSNVDATVNYNNEVGGAGAIEDFIQATLASNVNEKVNYNNGGIGGGANNGLTTTQFVESTLPVLPNLPHDEDSRQILDLHFVDIESTIHKMLDSGVVDFAGYTGAVADRTKEMLQQTMTTMTGEEQATLVATAAAGVAAATTSVMMIDDKVHETATTVTQQQDLADLAVTTVDPQQSNILQEEVINYHEQAEAVLQQSSQPTDMVEGDSEMMFVKPEIMVKQQSQQMSNVADATTTTTTTEMIVQDQVVQQQQYVDATSSTASGAITDMSNVIATVGATPEASDAATTMAAVAEPASSVVAASSAAEMATTAATTISADSVEQRATIQSMVPGSLAELGEIIIKGLQFIGDILYQALDTVVHTISGGDSMTRQVFAARASIDSVVSDAINSIQSTSTQISKTTVGDICEGLVSLVIMAVKILFQIMSWIVVQLSGKGIPEWVTEATTAMHDASQNLLHELVAFGNDVGSTTFAEIGEMVGYFLSEVARFIVEVFDSVIEFGGAVSAGGVLENALTDNTAIEGITSTVVAVSNYL